MFTLKKIFPGLPETERGRGFIFKADPKGEKIIYGLANSNPADAEIVTNHPKKVTAAAYAPSGNYICSGDAAGNLKIWDTIGEEHKIKYEYTPLAGNVTDICWSEDNTRIAAVGMGREKFSCVISWDSGTNIGQIAGQSKSCNTVDFRQARPYSIVTGSEDYKLMHFKGPPFKYDRVHNLHSNFVNCVRYSKDSSLLASAGSDGKTCEKLDELIDEGKDKAHDGGVYGISWSPCNTKLLSCSADKTCKIWNITDKKVEKTFSMGDTLNDQQVGCLWVKDQLLSLSLSGKINFLDYENPEKPKKCFWGHNKGIVACGISSDRKSLVTGSYDGVLSIECAYIDKWDIETGECSIFEGPQDSRQISAFAIYGDEFTAIRVGKIVTFGSVAESKFYEDSLVLESEALSVAMLDSETAVVGCINRIYLLKKRAIVHMMEINDEAVSIVAFDGGKKIAVGRSGRIVSFYIIDGEKIKGDDRSLVIPDGISSLSVSHSQKLLAVSSISKVIYLYDIETSEEVGKWTVQANRVNCAVFSEDDEFLATSGVDGVVLVMSRINRSSRVENRLAHRMYNCPCLIWLNSNTLISFGQQDCTIKFWDLKFK